MSASRPFDPGAALAQARVALQSGALDQAERLCRDILGVRPDLVEAWYLLAQVALAVRQYDAARRCLAMALEGNPAAGGLHNAVGLLEVEQGNVDAAIQAFRRGVALAPDDAAIWSNLGARYFGRRWLAEACAVFDRAIVCNPSIAQLYFNRGATHEGLRQFDLAAADCETAVAFDPSDPGVWSNLALVRFHQVRPRDGLAAARRSSLISPDDQARQSIYLMMLCYDPDGSRGAAFAAHRAFGASLLERAAPQRPTHRAATRRDLRIGYVSGDFRHHAIASFIEPILRLHDRGRFRPVCYDANWTDDAVAGHLRALPDIAWRNVTAMPTGEALARIAEDEIDILVDLSGHTGSNRLDLFASPGGPLKVTMQGYPNTTGLSTIDYRLTDAWQDPPGEADSFYSERLFRMDGSCWVFSPPDHAPPPYRPVGDRLVLGSICESRKLNPPLLRLWAEVLRGVPDATFRFLAIPEGSARRRIADIMGGQGIAATRLEFVERLSKAEFYQAMAGIDLALDSVPYNGGATTLEALWSGTPVISLAGGPMVSRMALGLLNAIGLGELAVVDRAAFVTLVRALATDRARLDGLRRTVRDRLLASPLTDLSGFVRRLEDAYIEMLAADGREYDIERDVT